jgi:hypothetical protein
MILWTIPGSMRWYLLGLAQAGLAAAGLHLLNSAFLAHDPQAMSYVRGAWGEDNTRTDLARARRKRLCGGWVNSIELQIGDIDHLVVTRLGGVVAIDSKWRTRPPTRMSLRWRTRLGEPACGPKDCCGRS